MNPTFRKDTIVDLCRNKRVLHLGYIQHAHLYIKLMEEGLWLHEKIHQVANYLVGIDYLDEEVKWFRGNTEYEVYAADVTRLDQWDYHERFDVIVCGELIEHLENPGLMLNGLKRLMHQDSELIITTPNPWSRNRLRLVRKGEDESLWVNPEHTCWFSYQTLKQILDRTGFEEISYGYYFGETKNEVFPVQKSVFRPFAKLKRWYLLKSVKERYYTGLFFRVKLKQDTNE